MPFSPKILHHITLPLIVLICLTALLPAAPKTLLAAQTVQAASQPDLTFSPLYPFIDDPFNNGMSITRSVVLGDFNSDGALDLVLGGWGASQVYLNNGHGRFAPTTSPLNPDGNNTNSVAVGDLNGDGALDLVLGNIGSIGGCDVSSCDPEPSQVYLNDGYGNFTPTSSPLNPDGNHTSSVAVGDFNGDGALDLVLGNSGWCDLNSCYPEPSQVYLNDGQGNFTPTATPLNPDGGYTKSVAVGDLDGDGLLDLVLGNDGGCDLHNCYPDPSQVYLNDGQGNFTPTATSLAPSGITSVAVGDFDGDGTLDLVLGAGFGADVYLNDKHANFAGIAGAGDGTSNTTSIAVGDLNGDGALDLVLGNGGAGVSYPSQVYLNDGYGYLTPTATALNPDGSVTSSIAIGDLNSDGMLDLVLGNGSSNSDISQPSQVYLNDKRGGNFTPAPTPINPDGNSTHSIAMGDFNGDGALDLVLGNSDPSQVYLNDRQGNFTPTDTPLNLAGDWINSVAVGDLNGDGALDLVLGNVYGPSQVYLNDGQGNFTPTVTALNPDGYTSSVAVGDFNGDGALDLVFGNAGLPSQVYLNDERGGFTSTATPLNPTGNYNVNSIAVGDFNGDGALDLVLGNWSEQSQVYLNDGQGNFTPTATPLNSNNGYSYSVVAVGDFNGDGALDLVLGNNPDPSQVYLNDGQGNFTPTSSPLNPTGNQTISVAVGDLNGDGTLDLVLGNGYYTSQPSQVYLNDGHANFTPIATLINPAGGSYASSIAIGDLNGDNALDLVLSNNGSDGYTSQVYLNGIGMAKRLPNNLPTVAITRPVPTSNANFFSTPTILNNSTIPISYTITDPDGDPVRELKVWYSLDGGGKWFPAVAASGTITTNLSTSSSGIPHTFVWDTFASGFFGQSDNVVVRMLAYPGPSGKNSTPLFQRPYTSATTFPFRVRGTQVRVVDPQGAGVAGAISYRLPTDPTQPRGLIAPSEGQPAATTNQYGYLGGRGTLAPGDTLVALAPVPANQLPAAMRPFSDTIDLYATNIAFTQGTNGLQLHGTPVQASGVQTVTTSLQHPLALVNLVVSLEWDARSDERFMTQLRYNLNRTSELLFDASNGQMALGQVHVFFQKENWDHAHLRIAASNRVRPNAVVGGVATTPFTSTYTVAGQPHPVGYGPGQVTIGATWNRFGEAGTSIADDWPRVLVHELGHYLFFLDDNYVGLHNGQIIPIPASQCPGLMNDAYASIEFHPNTDWSPGCNETLSQQETGQSDWATITSHYPILHGPHGTFDSAASQGPVQLNVPFTELYEYAPLTPTLTLASPVFNTVDQAGQRIELGVRSHAYLFQKQLNPNQYQRIVPLGRANLDQVFARGAHEGDRLCVFAERQQWVGCEPITAGNEQLPVTQWGTHGRPAWQPDVKITPITATTFQIQVGNVEAGKILKAAIYPVENPRPELTWPPAITLTEQAGIYQERFTLPALLSTGFVQLWVEGEHPRRETVVSFGMEGNAGGFLRSTGGGFLRSTGGGFLRSTGGGGVRSSGGGFLRSTGGGFLRSTGGGFIRTGNASVATSEGDVLFNDPDLTFTLGQFLLLQQVAAPPTPPAGTTFVGTSYRFTVPANHAPVIGPQASVSFSYLGAEVPMGEEDGIRVYYYNPQAANPQWRELATTLDINTNLASAAYQGPGIYTLMSSVRSELIPGWNSFGYPIQRAQPPAEAFAAAQSQYNLIYSYDPSDTNDPWKVYSPDVPSWVNDLGCLQFSQSYWVHTTATTTVTLRLRSSAEVGETNRCIAPTTTKQSILASANPVIAAGMPATYYGIVNHTNTAGQTVVATIAGQICGQGPTRLIDGKLVYSVNVRAVTGFELGCGATGRIVSFSIAGVQLGSAVWRNDAVQQLDLGIYQIRLPLVVR